MDSFTVEAFTLLTIGIAAIAIRLYSRWSSVGVRGLKLDDYLMLVAGVSTSGSLLPERQALDVLCHSALASMDIDLATTSQKHNFSQQAGCLLPRNCNSLRRRCLVAWPG